MDGSIDEILGQDVFELVTGTPFVNALNAAAEKVLSHGGESLFFVTRDRTRRFTVGITEGSPVYDDAPAFLELKPGENYPFLYCKIGACLREKYPKELVHMSFGDETAESSLLMADGTIYEGKALSLVLWNYRGESLLADVPEPKYEFNRTDPSDTSKIDAVFDSLFGLDSDTPIPPVESTRIPLTDAEVAMEARDIKRSEAWMRQVYARARMHESNIKAHCKKNGQIPLYLNERGFRAWHLPYRVKESGSTKCIPAFTPEKFSNFRARVDLDEALGVSGTDTLE